MLPIKSVCSICYRSFILGDVNNDGHEDLIVGAPEFGELGQAQLGAVYIIYGAYSSSTSVMILSTSSW